MEEGLRWKGRALDRGGNQWIDRTVQASPACRELLKNLSARSVDARSFGTGRPRGTVDWTMELEPMALRPGAEGWQQAIGGLLPNWGSGKLLELYKRWWGCGRASGDSSRCDNDRCPRCWNFRDPGLVNTGLRCSNVWAGAPGRLSGGTGTIRGARMVDAAENVNAQWVLSAPPYAMDVEMTALPRL